MTKRKWCQEVPAACARGIREKQLGSVVRRAPRGRWELLSILEQEDTWGAEW